MTLEERFTVLGGLFTYRQLVAGASPWWVDDNHLCTDDAKARHRQWCLDGGLMRPAPDVRETIQYFGDPPVLPIVVAALESIAPPARDYVLATTQFISTGWSTYGWTNASPSTRHQLVVLSCERRDPMAIWEVVLHECAHVWLEATRVAAATTVGQINLREESLRAGWHPELSRAITLIESRAKRLASTWEIAGRGAAQARLQENP